MEASDIRNLQEAYLEVYQELDEAEGSYGQTPKAHAAFNKLRYERASTNSRNFKGKKGGKTAAVDRASRHTGSSGGWHPDPGKKSPRPVSLTIRQKMTQNDRDFARQEREYYNSDDYDGGDFYGNPNPNGPRGGMPKGKKLTRQRKTGVSAESYDLILSHLLDEGYTNTIEGAEVILENMSEGWMESIMEAFVDPETGEAPSGRSPLENVSYHPKKSVRKKAMRAFAKQMSKEYGGKYKAKTEDPTKED